MGKMSREKRFLLLFLVALTVCGLPLYGALASTPTPPPRSLSGAIRYPDDHVPPAVETALPPEAAAGGLKAVAIVGDVGSFTASYEDDMDAAVTTLQGYDVAVTRFYYGETSFTWADIVAAAQGAQFLLYMGHGVYGGSMPYPDWVGGFYLGNGQFVSPNQIRNDLDGVMAPQSFVIFSHACFSAGSAAGDPSDLPQSEARRRVEMYADPFIDIGMQAYFADNYYNSAARTVDLILSGYTMGDTFRERWEYSAANFVALSYPEPGYNLWLDGTPGHWYLSFVGIPGYVFVPSSPALGNLPDAVHFIYSIPQQRQVPLSFWLAPANVGSDDVLTWTVATTGTWFTTTVLSGTTPDALQVVPTAFDTTTVAVYSGALTVTVVLPSEVDDSPHRVNLSLYVIDSPIRDLYLPLVLQVRE